MYHCYLHFYLAGSLSPAFDTIRSMPPLEHFSHEFEQSDLPDVAMASRADVILYQERQDGSAVMELQKLLEVKRGTAQVIVLAGPELAGQLAAEAERAADDAAVKAEQNRAADGDAVRAGQNQGADGSLDGRAVPRDDDQQHSGADLVQGQRGDSQEGQQQLLPCGWQDEAAGRGTGSLLYLGCGSE